MKHQRDRELFDRKEGGSYWSERKLENTASARKDSLERERGGGVTSVCVFCQLWVESGFSQKHSDQLW